MPGLALFLLLCVWMGRNQLLAATSQPLSVVSLDVFCLDLQPVPRERSMHLLKKYPHIDLQPGSRLMGTLFLFFGGWEKVPPLYSLPPCIVKGWLVCSWIKNWCEANNATDAKCRGRGGGGVGEEKKNTDFYFFLVPLLCLEFLVCILRREVIKRRWEAA